MKLRGSELAALLLTLVFLAVTAGYQLGLRHDPAEVAVTAASDLRREGRAEPARGLPAAETEEPERGDGRVNLNTAPAEELKRLDGVGDVLAERIVAYREAHGPFETVEDLMRVSGIGETIFASNRDRLTVD